MSIQTIFEELEDEKIKLASLFELDILVAEPYPDYDNFVKLACYISEAPIALLVLADKVRVWYKDTLRWNADEAPKNLFSFLSNETGVLIEVSDMALDERFTDHSLINEYPEVRFYAEIALVSSDKKKLGTLCILDSKIKSLTNEQKDFLTIVVRQLVIQIELKMQKIKLKLLNTGLLKDMQQRIEQKDKILTLFSRFVPPEVITKHIQSEITGFSDAELKHCAILFCDIRGYTSLVENESPRNAVGILNIFYTIMSDVIKDHSGLVVQYVGDEIFAVFGKPFSFPEYERNAVFCAIEMMNQLTTVNDLCKEFTEQPIKIGIGINAGEVITGTLGSDVKIEFCVTGNNVNIGKRIESLTKDQPDTILISETVYEKVKDLVDVKAWEPIEVKGKTDPLNIFEVTGKVIIDNNFPYRL